MTILHHYVMCNFHKNIHRTGVSEWMLVPVYIDHISEIQQNIDHITEKNYLMKGNSVPDHLKIDQMAEKTIYPKTI